MDDIIWVNKEKGGWTRKAEDVSIRKVKNGISIIVRNNWYEELTTTEYIRFGFSKSDRNKLYFMASTPESGWKLTKGNTLNYSTTVRDERLTTGLIRFEGDYNIEISEDNLFYIDRRNVK